MNKINAFIFTTLNGYYKGDKEDITWHPHDQKEENEFAAKMFNTGNALLFGRVTYQMMASHWPTAEAKKRSPEVAGGMNGADKYVFSNSLKDASWENTKIIRGNFEEEIIRLKKTAGKDITVLGSGSILNQLAENNLLDELMIMVDPVILEKGTTVFNDCRNRLKLQLTDSKTFKSGTVLLSYKNGG